MRAEVDVVPASTPAGGPVRGHGGSRTWSVTAAALALALAAGILEPATPAFGAPRQIVILSQDLLLHGDRVDFDVCIDEDDFIEVEIYWQITYRRQSDPVGTRRTMNRPPNQPERLLVDIDDPQILDVTPPFHVVNPPIPGSIFRVTGKKAGATTVRVRDSLRRAHQYVVRVHVKDCIYKVSATSVWHLDFGFKPTLYARIPDIELHRTGPGEYEGTGKMQNRAVGHFDFCAVAYDTPPSGVTIKGRIRKDPGGDVLVTTIHYAEVSATPSIFCNPSGGEGKGKGTPFDLIFDAKAWKAASVRKTVPGHLLKTELATPSTDTEVVVTMVPQ